MTRHGPPGADASPLRPASAMPVVSALEHLLLEAAIALVNVRAQEIDAAIEGTLELVGRFSRTDRAVVFRYDWEAGEASQTHEWCAPGVAPLIDTMQRVAITTWPDAGAEHRRGRSRQVDDVQQVAPGPMRRFLLEHRLNAFIDEPLMDGDHCLGFLGFQTVGTPTPWTEADQRALRLLAELLVNVEYRRRHDAALLRMRDLATVNVELEAFSGVVAHDLRSPLTSIAGFLDVVLSGGLSLEESTQLLRRARAVIDRLDGLIDQLLVYAMSGRVLGDVAPVALDAVVAEALERTRGELDQRQAEVVVASLPSVLGDHDRLVQVVANLLSNAVQHLPADTTPRIVVSGHRREDDVELVVADNGPGIEAAERSRLLTAFETAGPTAGSGLGLAIVRRVVDSHGGWVSLEDADEGGLVVRMLLPVAPEQPRAAG